MIYILGRAFPQSSWLSLFKVPRGNFQLLHICVGIPVLSALWDSQWSSHQQGPVLWSVCVASSYNCLQIHRSLPPLERQWILCQSFITESFENHLKWQYPPLMNLWIVKVINVVCAERLNYKSCFYFDKF